MEGEKDRLIVIVFAAAVDVVVTSIVVAEKGLNIVLFGRFDYDAVVVVLLSELH